MSAANLIVGPSAAFLLLDRASFYPDGRVARIGPKFVVSDRLKVAVGHCGLWSEEDQDALASFLSLCGSQETAMRWLPDFVREQGRRLEAKLTDPTADRGLLTFAPVQALFVAIWSTARRRPEGYVITTGQGTFPSHVRPGELHGARQYISPTVDCSFYSDDNFRPERDGLRLLEVQRTFKDERGRYVVGGGVDLVSVAERGAEAVTLRTWPDQIGHVIRPSFTRVALGRIGKMVSRGRRAMWQAGSWSAFTRPRDAGVE